MLNRYAVMGDPIAHSLSPAIHQWFANQTGQVLTYEKISMDPAYFEQYVVAFFAEGGKGLNVTMPFKERAFAMSDQVSTRCKQARAANTLWMESGQLHADNTDGLGFVRDIQHYVTLLGRRILVLGAGGAVRGILGPVLDACPASLTIVNRTPEKAHALQHDFPVIDICSLQRLETKSYDLIINATARYFDGESLALPKALMREKPFCYDLAYQETGITAFVAWARGLGCQAEDGLGMLVEQAAEAFSLWHGVMPETKGVLNHFRQD